MSRWQEIVGEELRKDRNGAFDRASERYAKEKGEGEPRRRRNPDSVVGEALGIALGLTLFVGLAGFVGGMVHERCADKARGQLFGSGGCGCGH